MSEAIKKLAFALTVLVITCAVCFLISQVMDYPPLLYIAAIGLFIIDWYFAAVDLLRGRGEFNGTPLGLIWRMVLIFIVFLSAGIAYTLIDTDWFLSISGIQGDLPYYVGCVGSAWSTAIIVRKEVQAIEKGKLLVAEKFVRNIASVLTVVIVPWMVLGISLWVTALNQWNPLSAWALSFVLAFAAYTAVSYALLYKRDKAGRGVVAGTLEDAIKILSRLKKPLEAGINWGGTLLPPGAASKHFLVVGTTGSGKTVTIKLLINSIAWIQV